MKTDITQDLVQEHVLILRMIALLERNATEAAAGRFAEWNFFIDGIDFIRQFADRYHHAKEEDVLFAALVSNGMPREHSPVAAMLMEHDQGRSFVRRMEAALNNIQAGSLVQLPVLMENALGYASLLRNHIAKEDTILYPLAERILPDAVRPGILANYAKAESKAPVDQNSYYQKMVERWEAVALVA